MRTNARVGHTFSFWPVVWHWSVKLHTSAEQRGGGAGAAQRLASGPLISSYEIEVGGCLRSHPASSQHLSKWRLRASQKLSQHPWHRGCGVSCSLSTRWLFQFQKIAVLLKGSNPLTVTLLITCLSLPRLSHVKAPAGGRGLMQYCNCIYKLNPR